MCRLTGSLEDKKVTGLRNADIPLYSHFSMQSFPSMNADKDERTRKNKDIKEKKISQYYSLFSNINNTSSVFRCPDISTLIHLHIDSQIGIFPLFAIVSSIASIIAAAIAIQLAGYHRLILSLIQRFRYPSGLGLIARSIG